MMRAMIVDFHAHLGQGPAGSDDLLQSGLSAEKVVGPAREAGVELSVVFPVTYPTYREANREIMEAARGYPQDLIGFARINPTTAEAMDELAEAARSGLRGLKLHHGCDGFDLRAPQVHEALEHCADLRWPVVFHSGGAVPELIELAKAHPRTPMVFGHMGGLWDWRAARQAIAAAGELANVYLETSGMLVIWMIEEAAAAVPEQVLFGTDAPAMHPTVEMTKIMVARMSDEARELILGVNATRLLTL